MKILIVGLGSMGKRRIRNLKQLKVGEITGFDINESRRKEAEGKYGIQTLGDLKDIKMFDALVVSTPPDKHNEYVKLAIRNKKPVFVEASVILEGLEELDKLAKKEKVLVTPSCTFRFHPAIKKITAIAQSGRYGKVTSFNYYLGQYLPDWHPWENIKNFYVGKKETGGAREMVAFELTWLTGILGFPKNVSGFYGKTLNMGVDIDDTYVISLDFGKILGNITIDVVARYALRSLILNMEKGQILWRWDENKIKLYEADNKCWREIQYLGGQTAVGYNKNIIEDMYVEEMKVFVGAIKGKKEFPNSLKEDIEVLKILNDAEKSNDKKHKN